MPRKVLKALAASLCPPAWRSGATEDESSPAPSTETDTGADTFVYDLKDELDHGRD